MRRLCLALCFILACRQISSPDDKDLPLAWQQAELPVSEADLLAAGLPPEAQESFNRFGSRAPQCLALLARRHGEARHAAEFLLTYMPARDSLTFDLEIFEANLDAAMIARQKFPWTRSWNQQLFFTEVLPSSFLSERRDPWRPWLLAKLEPEVRACSTARAACDQILARLPEMSSVKYDVTRLRTDPSALESWSSGKATCTGLSLLLASALRAVGIPARIAGTPEWQEMDGNHTWVEVHLEDGWHFIEYGAKPGSYDHGWILNRIVQMDQHWLHQVYATSYRPVDNRSFPMVWAPADHSFPAINTTDFYRRCAAAQGIKARLVSEGRLGIEYRQNGRRVAKPCRILNAVEREIFSGMTPSAAQDLNDLLSFSLPVGSKVFVVIGEGKDAVFSQVVVSGGAAIQKLVFGN